MFILDFLDPCSFISICLDANKLQLPAWLIYLYMNDRSMEYQTIGIDVIDMIVKLASWRWNRLDAKKVRVL